MDGDERIWRQCESPIERRLLAGLVERLGVRVTDAATLPELVKLAGETPTAFAFAQHRIGRYRADFMLVMINPITRDLGHLVIECDGKEFHSTVDQLLRDIYRDNRIADAGHRVLRLTGAEIYYDLCGATRKIEEIMLQYGIYPLGDSYNETWASGHDVLVASAKEA